MSDLILQDVVIEIKDLPSRAKALDDEGQDNVFGGFFRRRPNRRRRHQPHHRHHGRKGHSHHRRRVPVYAFRRVRVGWRFV